MTFLTALAIYAFGAASGFMVCALCRVAGREAPRQDEYEGEV